MVRSVRTRYSIPLMETALPEQLPELGGVCAAAPGTYGNVGRNSVVGPGYWDWSESVSRQFQVREGQKLEVRAEAFNVTNSLRRGNPGVSLANANTFGRSQQPERSEDHAVCA